MAHITVPEGVPGIRSVLAVRPEIAPPFGALADAKDLAQAREHAATDMEIHDTVLIAAVFCMFNRYVDGLAAWTPTDPDGCQARARMVAEPGYAASLPDAAGGTQGQAPAR